MQIKKVVAVFILVIFVTCIIGLQGNAMAAWGDQINTRSFTVVIDAGHGGIDGGVVGVESGVKESDINLTIAKKLEDYFKNAGIGVVMTRQTPQGLYGVYSPGFKRRDLEKRVEITEKANADVFISIHMNKFSQSSRRGAQVFYKIDEKSKTLAGLVQNSLNSIEQMVQSTTLKGDYYVLNNSPVPSIIAECGFLSNSEDEKLLLSEEYQQKLAYKIFIGTLAYFYEETNVIIDEK